MSIAVSISGIKGLQKALTSYAKTKTEELRDTTNLAAINVDREAKKMAPVGTPESTGIPGYAGGTLRSSIHPVRAMSFDPDTGETTRDLEAIVTTNVKYAPFVEFGTVKMSARPFLFPAWESERPEYIKRVKAILRRI